MDTLQSLMTPQKHHPHKHRCGKYCSLYAIDREIFICRNFRRVIWAYLSTIWDVCPSTVTLAGRPHRGLTNCQLHNIKISKHHLRCLSDSSLSPTFRAHLWSVALLDSSACISWMVTLPAWPVSQWLRGTRQLGFILLVWWVAIPFHNVTLATDDCSVYIYSTVCLRGVN